ncbi:hypothetical protein DFJ73DRAFT_908891 [Zopfochytrium polystomum]|nr:hypothetical protein DFJ73DRAFT_908891 [Zopfochytrium polystomum]
MTSDEAQPPTWVILAIASASRRSCGSSVSKRSPSTPTPPRRCKNASRRGLVELLDFRLRTATVPVGSVQPLDALFWTLHVVDVVPSPAAAAHDAPTPPLRIEWWIPSGALPERFETSNYDGFVIEAIRLAAEHGHINVLNWWMDRWPRREDLPNLADDDEIVTSILQPAVTGGRLGVLDWCRRRCPWSLSRVEQEAMETAANANQVQALEWLEKEAGLPAHRFLALNYGDDALQLEQLRKRREAASASAESADDLDTAAPFDFASAAAAHATAHGQIAVLDWIRAEGFSFDALASRATGYGQCTVLQWWKRRFPDDRHTPSTFSIRHAAIKGYVDVLQFWADFSDPSKWNQWLLFYAARGGQISVFQWWRERFPLPDPEHPRILVGEASHRGHVELLEWLNCSGFVQTLESPLTHVCTVKKVYAYWRLNNLTLTYDGGDDATAFILRNAANREMMEWLAEMHHRSGVDRCGVPADLEWPTLDLISVATTPLYSRGLKDLLDSVEWWRARGAVRGDSPQSDEKKRSVARNVRFLEWLLVRGLGVPFDLESAAGDSLVTKRWWADVKHRARTDG